MRKKGETAPARGPSSGEAGGVIRSRGSLASLLVLVLLAGPFSAVGCWDMIALRDYIFVGAVGVDRGSRPGWLRVSLLVTVPSPTAGSGPRDGSDSQTPAGISVAVEEGPTLLDATRALNRITNKIISYDQVRVMLIGEDLARQGVAPFIDPLVRSFELRRNLPVAVVSGVTAEEFLMRVRSDVDPELADYLAGVVWTAHSTFSETPLSRVRELDFGYVTPHVEIALARVELARKPPSPKPPGEEDAGEGGGGDGGGGEGGEGLTEARAAAAGTALFQGDRMVLGLDLSQTMGFLLVQGGFGKAVVTAAGEATQNTPVTFNILSYHRRVKARRVGGQIHLDLEVRISAYITDVAGPAQVVHPANYGALKGVLATELERRMTEVIDLVKTEVGGDSFNLSLFGRRTFTTWREWVAFDWSRAFREASISVRVEVTSLGTDLVFQPAAPWD